MHWRMAVENWVAVVLAVVVVAVVALVAAVGLVEGGREGRRFRKAVSVLVAGCRYAGVGAELKPLADEGRGPSSELRSSAETPAPETTASGGRGILLLF